MWLALAAVALAAAIGFSVVAFTIQFERLVGYWLVLRAALQMQGRRSMSKIAAKVQTADRVDYWIRRHVIGAAGLNLLSKASARLYIRHIDNAGTFRGWGY